MDDRLARASCLQMRQEFCPEGKCRLRKISCLWWLFTLVNVDRKGRAWSTPPPSFPPAYAFAQA